MELYWEIVSMSDFVLSIYHFHREKEAPRLTESGFQFLVWMYTFLGLFHLWCRLQDIILGLCKLQLMDTNAQLWYIIREYISNSEVWTHEILIVNVCFSSALNRPFFLFSICKGRFRVGFMKRNWISYLYCCRIPSLNILVIWYLFY